MSESDRRSRRARRVWKDAQPVHLQRHELDLLRDILNERQQTRIDEMVEEFPGAVAFELVLWGAYVPGFQGMCRRLSKLALRFEYLSRPPTNPSAEGHPGYWEEVGGTEL